MVNMDSKHTIPNLFGVIFYLQFFYCKRDVITLSSNLVIMYINNSYKNFRIWLLGAFLK